MKIEWVDKLPSVIDIDSEDRAISRILTEEVADSRYSVQDICDALVDVNSRHLYTDRAISSKSCRLLDEWTLKLCVVENAELMNHFVYFLINYPLVRCRVLLHQTAQMSLDSRVGKIVKDAIDELEDRE